MGCKKCKQKKIKDTQKKSRESQSQNHDWETLPNNIQDGILQSWPEEVIKKEFFTGEIPKHIRKKMYNLKAANPKQMKTQYSEEEIKNTKEEDWVDLSPEMEGEVINQLFPDGIPSMEDRRNGRKSPTSNTNNNPIPPISDIPMPENLESEESDDDRKTGESDDDRKTGEEYDFPHNEVIGDITGSFLIRLVTFAVVTAALPLIIVALLVQLFLTFFIPKSVSGINKKFKGFLNKIFIKYGEFKIKKERKKRDRQFYKNRGYDADSELLDIEVFDEGLDNKKTEVN